MHSVEAPTRLESLMSTRPMRIGILRARHDPSVENISDEACIAMMMTNAQNEAIFNYWSYVTRGHLDFRGSSLFPWVDISVTAGERLQRATHGQRAYTATAALPGAVMDGFDGFIVLTHPGKMTIVNPNAGKPNEPATVVRGLDGGAGYALGGVPACSLPVMTNNHTFFAHELGHVLGFKHSYGLWNNGTDWDGVAPFVQGPAYGDPYDLMSSASFGTRTLDQTIPVYVGNPTFVGELPAGWPNLGASSMGPAPALAQMHFWDPEVFPASSVKHAPYPTQGQRLFVRLAAAQQNSGATSLLVLHPPGEDALGRFRCYVEYRNRDGWDRGLHESGADLSRRAVVVHTLNDTDEGLRCWYRGRILVPTETDLDLAPAFTPLVVTVTDVDQDAMAVEVEITTSAEREVSISARHFQTLVLTTDEQVSQTPCGDTVISATRTYQSTSLYRAHTRGYGGGGDPTAPTRVDPVITWEVAGQQVSAGRGSVEVTVQDGVFTVDYDLTADPNELALIANGGQRYIAEVKAIAADPRGDFKHYATDSFRPGGWTEGFTTADLAKIDGCITDKMRRAFVDKRDWIKRAKTGDHPNWETVVQDDRLTQVRLQEIATTLTARAPELGAELHQLAQLRGRQLGPA